MFIIGVSAVCHQFVHRLICDLLSICQCFASSLSSTCYTVRSALVKFNRASSKWGLKCQRHRAYLDLRRPSAGSICQGWPIVIITPIIIIIIVVVIVIIIIVVIIILWLLLIIILLIIISWTFTIPVSVNKHSFYRSACPANHRQKPHSGPWLWHSESLSSHRLLSPEECLFHRHRYDCTLHAPMLSSPRFREPSKTLLMSCSSQALHIYIYIYIWYIYIHNNNTNDNNNTNIYIYIYHHS